MNIKNIKYRFPHWLVLPVLALITFGLTEWLNRHPDWTERYYSQGIYPSIAGILSRLSSFFPFSLDDLLYIMLILFAFFLLIMALTNKIRWKRAGKLSLSTLALVYVLFYFLWGFNYFRQDLNVRLNLASSEPDSNDFYLIFEKILTQTNATWCSFETFHKQKADSLIENSYQKLAPLMDITYPSGTRRAKNITFSLLFAKAGISGYFGPFFNEIHLNKNILPVEYPFILAHEKAHQFGVTSEAEANFLAWLVCTQSQSKQIRYSASLAALQYFWNDAAKMRGLPQHFPKPNEQVLKDLQRIRKHWLALKNEKAGRIASGANDAYLKTNKIEEGIDNYNTVVKLIMDYSLDQGFQKALP